MARKRFFVEIEAIKKELAKDQRRARFYSIGHIARMLNVGYMTIYREVTIGRLDGSLIRGSWRVPVEGLLKYLEKTHPFNQQEKK